MKPLLTVEAVSKKEGTDFTLSSVSFVQHSQRKLAVAGATGSGKSTLLKIIAGLLQPDEGRVMLGDARVEGPRERLLPGHPAIAYLSQHFELRNHYRVEELLAYANTVSEAAAAEIYRLCRIDHLMQRKNVALSGGERQRIALARLLVGNPKLLLLDEPYSNLDAAHTLLLKQVVAEIADARNITCLLVSHDARDTLAWADEILVLQHGKLIQQAPPQQLYRQPVNTYTAALFGPYNLLPAGLLPLTATHKAAIEGSGKQLLLRPEQLLLSAPGAGGVQAIVRRKYFQGSFYEAEVSVQEWLVRAQLPVETSINEGDAVSLQIKEGPLWYIH